ncbi:hypothetical protein [Seonamhaeicola sp.]|uniref:hypothetical protein n=1 Tax=Seonamhaeicola sp. TaxID=1912245 RepID=UPI002608B013|nr:hypothetical protein [Seonamhaeicola sp.]
MSVINKHISIPKHVASGNDLDYYYLREAGIRYIEQLGNRLWTDYNSHDPGITILEMLCYAITDLGMRMDMPVNDLLASDDPGKSLNSQFYKASEIFPSKPVTPLDYRKLFIDIDGVKNCWLTKFEKTVYVDCKNDKLSYNEADFSATHAAFKKEFILNGLYNILVDFDELDAGQTKDEIFSKIREAYHANRNLCEDLIEIDEVTEQKVAVCASIEVEPEADEEMVHAKVLNAIEDYFSPALRFYSITEMLDKQYTPDQIFDGPLLEHGFIDTEALKNAELRTEVRLSDIMKIIMNIEGVKLIKDISIGHCDASKDLKNDWVICIDKHKKPALCNTRTFSYHKGVLPLNINHDQVAKYQKELKAEEEDLQSNAKNDKVLEFPNGRHRAPDTYTTIMNDFPDTYGIGQEGLTARATTQRKSQAKQLKAYLLFFDKILASYFKHLAKVKDLLSINGTETKTFFTQAIKDVRGFEDLVKNYDSDDDDNLTELLFEQLDNSIERRNDMLDHLLARFAEKFGEYAFLMKILYGKVADDIVLSNKESFLGDYIAISSQRGCAFNYYKQTPEKLWDTNNISGVQKRISRLMGLKDYNRRHLSSSYVEIYKPTPAEEKYRWRIKDDHGNIILSATTHYPAPEVASRELYFSVLQIIQTSEKAIEDAFEVGVSEGTVIENLRIQQLPTGEYFFDVIDPQKDPGHVDYIVAKQFSYYGTPEALEDAILSIIEFMKYRFTEEGIFLVEHILLRPDVNQSASGVFMPICTNDCKDDCFIDPYSYRVSIVLPGYTFRFSNPDFRNYMETIIKEELPAHVLPRICWVGHRKGEVDDDKNDLLCFEDAYKAYLLEKTKLEQEQPENQIKTLLTALSKLNSVYPTGRLLDCADESDDLRGRIILGRTNLGTL